MTKSALSEIQYSGCSGNVFPVGDRYNWMSNASSLGIFVIS